MTDREISLKEFWSKGGKARWKGKTKKQRIEEMKRVGAFRKKKVAK